MKDRIIGVLDNGKRSVTDLADELDTKENAVRTTLNRHKDTFVKVGNDWGVLGEY